MGSTFSGIELGKRSIMAQTDAITTAGHNISNANTEGYSRQEAIQEASAALRVFTTYGCAGSGVDTIAIERIHDDFYDDKYRDSNQKLGRISAKAYYMKSVENYFQETDTINGFNSSFNLMYNALEEVQKNAGDKATKAQFVMYAQSLCDYFNSISNQLSSFDFP